MELTDKQLMLAVRHGQIEQFGVLFDRHHERLLNFFYRMTGDPVASEDLVQDVFVRMLRYRNTFGDDSEFRAWMYHIARNARADHFRKHRPDVVLEADNQALVRGGLQHRDLERRQYLDMLQRAFLRLPEDKRELLVLARYQEMKYEKIAALLDVDIGTVKVRVHRAMLELRNIFLKLSGENPICTAQKPENTFRSI
jgi:RNA polymerase sigma factor (sigma-70 family)